MSLAAEQFPRLLAGDAGERRRWACERMSRFTVGWRCRHGSARGPPTIC